MLPTDLWTTFHEGVGYKRFAISGAVGIIIAAFFFFAQHFGIASLLAVPHWAVGSVATLAVLLFWTLQYADQLRKQLQPNVQLSFNPELGVVVTPVLLANNIESSATSVRVLAQATTKVAPQNAAAFLTKFEKRSVGGGAWKPRQHHELVQLTWAIGGGYETDLSSVFPKPINVLHIGAHDNLITIWGVAMPLSLREFFKSHTTYRLTVAVIAGGRTSTARLEFDWKGQWDTIVVRPA